MEQNQHRHLGTAIIIGGSMAGLLAARVLSDVYREVLVVERDELPSEPANRAGTPQAFHPHRLTPRGIQVLERYFPGFNEELLTHGAPSSLGMTSHMSNAYGSLIMGPDPQNNASCSRALLEWVFRRRVQALPGVSFLTRHEATGLEVSADGRTVTGVRVRSRGPADAAPRPLSADLVLDASGRFSRLVPWLRDLGFDVPEPDILRLDLAYSTRRYRVPAGKQLPWEVIHTSGQPEKRIPTGVFSVIEDDTAESTLYSAGGLYPTTSPEAYPYEAARLTSPALAESIQELEPLGPPRGFRVPELVRQRFGLMSDWPQGLLVLGDAFCHFDPIFGQGITAAAMEAEILEEALREELLSARPGMEIRILGRIQELLEPAWWLNCTAGLRWPGVEYAGSEPLVGVEFAHHYFDLYLAHSIREQNMELYGLYWMVNTLLVSPNKLAQPELVTAVLAGASEAEKAWFHALSAEHGLPAEELPGALLPAFFRPQPAETPSA
ncbi:MULTISPECIES: NAD(P)/FAD-dependent oxidoreductase [Paenibacillus]|uniref:NAD(P)/FAD-dependent oxidoreductase n=1 Tax=Paenibacillus TaxID=44249 RepID=UPI0022B87145|nr:FAD-dependent monooxygenase [Paenibacillus caseinilyticus]MCZ8521275.1 FAD dependent oxidoreductase [Paenibacillus caseinilyticus]